METLLEIRDLSVTFQDVEGTRAARHVNLQLKKGELAALVGSPVQERLCCAKPYYSFSEKRPV